jgi:eight-cysteine-cluster-containing protein
MLTMRRLFLVALGIALAAAGCASDEAGGPEVTARNLATGEIKSFASEGEVPSGWSKCGDPTCSVPGQVPCHKLGPKVCALHPECRLKELWCKGEGCACPACAPGASCPPCTCPPPKPPVCEYACIPKLPLLCEELTGQKQCQARKDCEWAQAMCPAIACAPNQPCPPCPFTCISKAPPICQQLAEAECKSRKDCEWGFGPCPMCYPPTPGGPCECKPSCLPAPVLPCSKAECGPAPGMPSQICPDGIVAGPRCERVNGKCGWVITSCPTPPPPPPPPPKPVCKRGGCSGTVCSDKDDVATTCEWADHYACYDLAVCGVTSGACGWTKTPAFVACMTKFGQKP